MIGNYYSIFTPLWTCARHCMWLTYRIHITFHPNRTTPADFSRWRPWHHNSYSRCVFCDGTRL